MHHHHRQERWLHARISADLEEALKREARRRRAPVSLLVRNVLEGALDLVEEIVEDGFGIAKHSQRFADRAGRNPSGGAAVDLSDVYGWQELIINRAARCARCHTTLAVGVQAYRGLCERPGTPAFLCGGCVRRLRHPVAAGDKDNGTRT